MSESSSTGSQCLGCGIITVQAQESSSANQQQQTKASLLVFLDKDAATVQLHLCTDAADVYQGHMAVSDLEPLWSSSSHARKTSAWIGQLFLDKAAPPGGNNNNPLDKVQLSFALQQDGGEKKPGVEIAVKQEVQGGMMKIVAKTTLEALSGGDSDNGTSSGVLPFFHVMGDALNHSLKRSTKMENRSNVWEQSARELDAKMQSTKDSLFANFTELRNKMYEKHQKEIADLKEAHEEEKREWKDSSAAAAVALKSKNRQEQREELANAKDDLDNRNELFADDEVKRYAKGERMTATTKRKRILDPKETGDVVDSIKELRKQQKEKKRSKEADNSGSETDDSIDKEVRKKLPKQKKPPKPDDSGSETDDGF